MNHELLESEKRVLEKYSELVSQGEQVPEWMKKEVNKIHQRML